MDGKWHFKHVVKLKFWWTVGITAILSYWAINGINKWLNWYLNRDEVWIKPVYSVGIFGLPIILLIYVAVVNLIKGFLNYRLKKTHTYFDYDSYPRKPFLWNFAYTIMLVLPIFYLSEAVVYLPILIYGDKMEENGWPLSLLLNLALPVPFVLTSILTKAIRQAIVRKLGNNSELIADVKKGLYDRYLPEPYNSEKGKYAIVRALKMGSANTIDGAMDYVRKRTKIIKGTLVTAGISTVFFGYVLYRLAKYDPWFIKEFKQTLKDIPQWQTEAMRRDDEIREEYYEKKREEDERKRNQAWQENMDADKEWKDAAYRERCGTGTHEETVRARRKRDETARKHGWPTGWF